MLVAGRKKKSNFVARCAIPVRDLRVIDEVAQVNQRLPHLNMLWMSMPEQFRVHGGNFSNFCSIHSVPSALPCFIALNICNDDTLSQVNVQHTTKINTNCDSTTHKVLKKSDEYGKVVLEKFVAGTITKEECETLLAQAPTSDAVKKRSDNPNRILPHP